MHHSSCFKLTQLVAIPTLTAGLLSTAIWLPSAQAASQDYQQCANSLLGAGVSPEGAASACAAALHPEELSGCVADIASSTSIVASDALSGCGQVRRPEELATCVVDISQTTEVTDPNSVLDYCRRSLLLVRFSDCVVGLSQEIDVATIAVLDTCIAAGDRPTEFLPSFIPATEAPTTPTQFQNFTPLPQ